MKATLKKGGKRSGAGRPAKTYETKSITFYIRLDWEKEFREIFKRFRNGKLEALRIKEDSNTVPEN
jgi:hypothetical protein